MQLKPAFFTNTETAILSYQSKTILDDSPLQRLSSKVAFKEKGESTFEEGRVENRARTEKYSVSLG